MPKSLNIVLKPLTMNLFVAFLMTALCVPTNAEGSNSERPNKATKIVKTNANQLKLPADSLGSKTEPQAAHQRASIPSNWLQATPPTIDGSNNNRSNPSWGRANIAFTRLTPASYANGRNSLANASAPSPRVISNQTHATSRSPALGAAVSDMFWQWGQFLDHDITLTPELTPAQRADISIPAGDPWFDPAGDGNRVMHFDRSGFVNDARGVRQQVNVLSAYIDASQVYGSDARRAAALRANDGSGRLRTSVGNLLPFNTSRLENAPNSRPAFFLAGDFRANEQVGLTALHTIFVREHNRIAGSIGRQHPSWSGERRYQYARGLVAALMQRITYYEFLPKLLGGKAIPAYSGYKPYVNASISNEFATAAFRVGHTMLSSQILRITANGKADVQGPLRLRDAFFSPGEIRRNGIDTLLRGLCQQRAQKVDIEIVDDVRNVLFANVQQSLDLAALNIQRGRDHGLSTYNASRQALGLDLKNGFDQINSAPAVHTRLSSAYRTVGDIDLWVGGLAEPSYRGAMVGQTFYTILADQFIRLRDGDRYWYQNYLPPDLQAWVNQQTLSKVLQRNSGVASELPEFAMLVPNAAPLGAILPLLFGED